MVTITLYVRQQKRQMYRTVFWTLWERARGGWYGRMALKHVNYHMWYESPVQVQCMIQGARGWCTGITQRDGIGREVGGGFRMGNTCTPMVDSYQCMTEPIQYCKIKKERKKENWKKIKCLDIWYYKMIILLIEEKDGLINANTSNIFPEEICIAWTLSCIIY